MSAALEIRAAEPTMLRIAEIVLDPEILLRPVDEETAQGYADAVRSHKAELPAITVVRLADGTLLCVDGQHRVRMHVILGREEIACEIQDGDRLSALRLAASCNTEHGKPRDTETKRRAVLALHAQPEWKGKSARWLAETARVSTTFASAVLKTVHGGQLPATEGKDGKVRKAPSKAKRKPFDAARQVKTLSRVIDQLAKKWPRDTSTAALVELLINRAGELEKRSVEARS